MTGTPCLSLPNDRTEAEARAAGHTPTPWARDAASGVNCDVRAASGRKVALCWGLTTGDPGRPAYRSECDANAHFIVLAVNAHDAMKAVLTAVQPVLDQEIEDRKHGGNAEDWRHLQSLSDQLHAALAVARGAKA